MKKLSIIIISIFLLGIVGCKNNHNKIDDKFYEKEIPNLKIKCNGENLYVEKGSYEWRIGNECIMVDAMSPIQIGEILDGNKVSPNDKLQMYFTKKPSNISVILWQNEEKKINFKNDIAIPKINGSYIYEVVGHWPDGEVSYTIKLIVEN